MSKIGGSITYSNSGKIVRQIASPVNRSAPRVQSYTSVNKQVANPYQNPPNQIPSEPIQYHTKQPALEPIYASSQPKSSKINVSDRQRLQNLSSSVASQPIQTSQVNAPRPRQLLGYSYHENIAPPSTVALQQPQPQYRPQIEANEPEPETQSDQQQLYANPLEEVSTIELENQPEPAQDYTEPNYQDEEIDYAILQHSPDLYKNQPVQDKSRVAITEANYTNNDNAIAQTASPSEYASSSSEPNVEKTVKKPLKLPSLSMPKLSLSKKLIPVVAVFAIIAIAVAGNSFMNGTVNNLKYKIAGSKAGIDISAPKYVPVGYSLGTFSYSSHIVSTEFKSVNGKKYSLIQEKSSWNNSQLVSNFVSNTDPDYQSAQLSNIDVYLYGNGNATWVNNGKWYIIESNGNLSDNELEDIASSL